MNPAYQLIESSMRRSGLDEQGLQRAMGGLGLSLRNPGTKLVHLGNSVFMVTVTAPNEVEVHTFSQETPQALAQNYVNLAKFLKNIGVKVAKTYSDDPRFQKIAQMTGLPVKVAQTQKMFGKEMKPAYEYVLEL